MATVSIYTRNDRVDERDENVGLRLYNLSDNASFAGGGDEAQAMGVIHDNDGAGGNMMLLVSDAMVIEGDSGTREAVFELRLSQPAPDAMTLTYATRDITARNGEDYVEQTGVVNFAAGEEVKTVRVPVVGDTEVEFTERFGLRVDTSSVALLNTDVVEAEAVIRDDDTTPGPVITVSPAKAIEGNMLLYTLRLSEPSQDAVTVDYAPQAGTADETDLSYGFTSRYNVGTVTFEPGQTSQTVMIYTRNDSTDERDEDILFEFSNVTNAVLADGAPSVLVPGTILDNDGVGQNLTASVTPTVLREHGVDSFIYEVPVELSAPATNPLSFTVEAIDQTAVAGSDYRLLDTRVSFLEGQRVATVSIAVLGDSVVESTEAFSLSLEPVAGTPYAGSVADTVIQIRPGPLMPSAGPDVLVGTVGNDTINLLGGDDHYRGLEGNDTVFGSGGTDTVIGGGGSDMIDGGPGADLLIGGDVADVSTATGAQVFRVFQATLGRSPDSTGYGNWSERLDHGEMTLLEVIDGFVRSPEFQTSYGALGNAAFVRLLYQNVLDRDADANGLANWTARLDSGMSRAEVVRGFSESAEFRENTNDAASAYVAAEAAPFLDDVFRLYQATLGRSPDLTGLANWSGRLAEDMDYTDVAAGFVGSPEFQNVYGALSNRDFVTLLYENVLDRAPDASGLANWSGRLDDGMSREEVVRGFAQSAEFVAGTEAQFGAFMAAQEGDTLRGGPGGDLIHGSMLADEFRFNVADKGADRVLQLDPWDTLAFTGFGYGGAGAVQSHMREVGRDVIFADQGVSVTFMNTDLESVENVAILV